MKQHPSRLLPFLVTALFLVGALACGLGKSATISVPTEAATNTPVPESAVTPTPKPTDTPTPKPTDTPTPEPESLEVLEATLALGVDEEGQAVNTVEEFTPDQAIYVVLTLKGWPKGIMTGRFYRGDHFLGEASLDLASIESDVPLSSATGGETYVHFSWTPDPGEVIRISDAYRLEVFYEDELVGSYPFQVVPPEEAIASQIREVVLARGVDDDYNPIKPGNIFAPDETVYLLMHGDFGLHTWLETEWYVDGQLDETGPGSVTIKENGSDKSIYFYFLPEDGWPVGEHQVLLRMNDEEVGRYDFSVEEAPASSLVPFEDPNGVFKLSYPAHFDQVEERTAPDGYGYTFLASDASGAIYLYFSWLGTPLSEEQWQAFADDYTLAGLPGFGEDAVELNRQVGDPGVHVILLEGESEESGLHGLIWVEEAEGAMAVATLVTPIEGWAEQEDLLFEALDSFIWSPDAVSALAPPLPEPAPTLPPPSPTPAPEPPPSSEWWPGQPDVPSGMACFLVVSDIAGEVTFNLGPQTQKIAPNGHVWFVIEPGHTTWTGDLPDGRRGGGELDIQPDCEPFVNVLRISG